MLVASLCILAACNNETGHESNAVAEVQAGAIDTTSSRVEVEVNEAQGFKDTANSFNDSRFLPVDEAFKLDLATGDQGTELVWIVADDYYLYKHKFRILANFDDKREPQNLTASTRFSPGLRKTDEYYGNVEVFYHQAVATISAIPSSQPTSLTVQYQGCADAGLCYPVQTRTLLLN